MKALYKYAPGGGTSRLEDRPIPQITPLDNVRVRVSACAVCGMDIHIYHGKFACDPPFVMGHEFVGRVESVGPEVTSVAPGSPVVQPDTSAVRGHIVRLRAADAQGVDGPGIFRGGPVGHRGALDGAEGGFQSCFFRPCRGIDMRRGDGLSVVAGQCHGLL